MTKRRAKWTCPEHGIELSKVVTRYGVRWRCSMYGCTVACWGGRTSTPADAETRTARRNAHDAFDPLWKQGPHKRSWLYRQLAEYFGEKEVHIGQMNKEQAERVLEFVKTVPAQNNALKGTDA